MPEAQLPSANATLICDSVITEAGTNKKSLIGVFENINALAFPLVHPSLCVYVKLTEARGTYRFRLELADLETGTTILSKEIPGPVAIDNPLGTHEMVFNLRNLRFEHPGTYEFRICANGRVFAQKAFVLTRLPQRGSRA